VSLAALIVYKTNFFRQVWENPHVNQFFLKIALTCITFMVTVLVYVSIIGPCIKRKEIDFEKDMPSMVPVMALAGVLVFVCSILALWPVWGILTPVYMLILTFGSTFSMMFLPSGKLGNLLFWVGLLLIAYVSHTLPHDPVW
jgi:hypothetical protein